VSNWVIADTGQRYALTLDHSALTYLADRHAADAGATVTLDRAVLDRIVLRETRFADAVRDGAARVEGDAAGVAALFELFDDFALMFPVVEPRPGAPAR
jgi:alkyl sulfatase BDS1-like metallo-beta-lactamase superfamily hydrolase